MAPAFVIVKIYYYLTSLLLRIIFFPVFGHGFFSQAALPTRDWLLYMQQFEVLEPVIRHAVIFLVVLLEFVLQARNILLPIYSTFYSLSTGKAFVEEGELPIAEACFDHGGIYNRDDLWLLHLTKPEFIYQNGGILGLILELAPERGEYAFRRIGYYHTICPTIQISQLYVDRGGMPPNANIATLFKNQSRQWITLV
jgi:hypothetical protein